MKAAEPDIRAQGIGGLYLFGSVARHEAKVESAIDLFVDPDPAPLRLRQVHGRLRTPAAASRNQQTLYDILDEKEPVTPAMALRLGRFFGNGPDFWLNLQSDYDLRTLEPKMREELAAIEPVAA